MSQISISTFSRQQPWNKHTVMMQLSKFLASLKSSSASSSFSSSLDSPVKHVCQSKNQLLDQPGSNNNEAGSEVCQGRWAKLQKSIVTYLLKASNVFFSSSFPSLSLRRIRLYSSLVDHRHPSLPSPNSPSYDTSVILNSWTNFHWIQRNFYLKF